MFPGCQYVWQLGFKDSNMIYYTKEYTDLTKEEAIMHPDSFAIEGQTPKLGDLVACKWMIYGGDIAWNPVAKVHRVDERGVPKKLLLPDGKIIEVVGLILELIGLAERVWLAIKALFDKEARAKHRAIKALTK